MRMIDADDMARDAARQQLMLMAWFSPAFPIGGFAFSHGLEWAQEAGALTNRAELEAWLGDLIAHGSFRADAIVLTESWRAAMTGDQDKLRHVAELSAAMAPSRERSMEAEVQGAAFMQVVQAAYPFEAPAVSDSAVITLPVAAGIAGAAHGIALPMLITAYLSAFLANLSSAAVRLGIVGQTDGQRVIAAVQPALATLARQAETLTLDDLGAAALTSDLFSMQHETQYSRLFRS